MKKTFPRAVIFDWDNTLVDSWGAIAEAINFVRAKYGLKVWDGDEIMAHCTRSARESFPDWFGDKWRDAWQDYYDKFIEARRLMGLHEAKGASQLLAWLSDKKVPMVVVSNKSGEHLRVEAGQMGWTQYFASIVGAHDAPRDKPAREHADRALILAGLKNGPHVWFIGDSETDILCARAAECTPVLIGDAGDAKRLGVKTFFADCAAVLEHFIKIKAL